jgi:hypothetical protein
MIFPSRTHILLFNLDLEAKFSEPMYQQVSWKIKLGVTLGVPCTNGTPLFAYDAMHACSDLDCSIIVNLDIKLLASWLTNDVQEVPAEKKPGKNQQWSFERHDYPSC